MTIQNIKNKGIVGAGGAGFPTHIKLQACPDVLIMNAAECEPLLHKDKELLLHFTDEILEGFRIALSLTGAKRGIIGIKEKHHALIDLLKSRISQFMEVMPIGDFYPAGDEVILIYLTTGRIIQPGQLPISEGCVVQNVETLYNLAQSEPLTDKFLTIAGEVDKPLTVKVPIGTSFRDVLSHFDITTRNAQVRSGGLMMGILESSLDAVVTKTTGGLILLPSDHACITMYQRYATPDQTDRMAKAACDQCSFCTELCPRYLLGHPVRPEIAMRNRMFTRQDMSYHHNGNAFCCECNLCTMYSCPEGLDPKGATVIEKKMSRDFPSWGGLPVTSHPLMNYRKVPTQKLKQRLDIIRYRDEGPLSDLKIEPKFVRIPLKQHIGTPAKSVVKLDQQIKRNDLIAEADGEISVPVHASVDGTVFEITENEIVIQRQP
ncbi:SLBB domain-containing protein [candidate division KSB1 bacterium]|nr:SLBB domain-containing protein [candidate division KSB1 bacterium]